MMPRHTPLSAVGAFYCCANTHTHMHTHMHTHNTNTHTFSVSTLETFIYGQYNTKHGLFSSYLEHSVYSLLIKWSLLNMKSLFIIVVSSYYVLSPYYWVTCSFFSRSFVCIFFLKKTNIVMTILESVFFLQKIT